jgi:hypothetical protein
MADVHSQYEIFLHYDASRFAKGSFAVSVVGPDEGKDPVGVYLRCLQTSALTMQPFQVPLKVD